MASITKRRECSIAYLYILPFFLLFFIFGVFPIFNSLGLSFTRQITIGTTKFVGLRNYARLFSDELFVKALTNTLIIWLTAHAVVIPGSFLLAFALHHMIEKGSGFYRTLFFTPVVTSSVAISLVFLTIFGKQFGILNQFLNSLGIPIIDWFGGRGQYIKPIIVTIFVWKWLGYDMVIFLAGMQGIDPTYYECARVEGAGVGTLLTKITIPLLKPIIVFILIMSFIGGLQIFDEPYILLSKTGEMGAGTNYAGLVLSRYLYYLAFSRWNFGYASSIAYFLVAFIVALSALSKRLMKEDKSA